jgi:2-hydroxy-3-keto-5-methylthiopentenyl-1-phosphate phosphatase
MAAPMDGRGTPPDRRSLAEPVPQGAGSTLSAGTALVPAGQVPVPPLLPGQIPVAILVDYDGTIALNDVTDVIVARHFPGAWELYEEAYDAGRMGSREIMTEEIQLLDASPAEVVATANEQPHDAGFAPFVRRARAADIPVEIVSDGFGFFIGPALARLGVPDLPIVTASTTFPGGRARIEFPNGHPSCLVCGTCKRNRVLAHQAAGRAVIFIGDGESDRYAAGYSDLVFAKNRLIGICEENGWPHRRFAEFADIEAWLVGSIAAWQGGIDVPQPARHPFFCGPEVWGPGLTVPPPRVPHSADPRTARA